MKKLTATFVLIAFYGIGFAQDSYKYAVVNYFPMQQRLLIYTDGQVDERNKVKSASQYDPTPLLVEIEKLSSEGWEVYSSNAANSDAGSAPTYYYFLRRKK